MPGPIELDPSTIRPMSDLAYQDDMGNWRAGPDAVENGQAEQVGQFISEKYAQKARSTRQNANAIKQNMRKQDMSESEAREYVNERVDELRQERSKDEPDQDRIDELQRALGGSP